VSICQILARLIDTHQPRGEEDCAFGSFFGVKRAAMPATNAYLREMYLSVPALRIVM
jgi:hypothetical protein